MTASVAARAARRLSELAALGQTVTLAEVEAGMRARDALDEERAVAPMRPAADAVHTDTTHLTANEVFERAAPIVRAATARLQE